MPLRSSNALPIGRVKNISEFSQKNIETINASHLSKGMYLLVVKTDKGTISKKIVK